MNSSDDRYDIFLSYATVDDTDLAEPWKLKDDVEVQGWVRCFKVALQGFLDRKLGRAGSAKWFLDAKDLRAGDHLTASIQGALDKTNLFVALASEGYFAQESWCKMEREHFVRTLGRDPWKARRVFGIILDEEALNGWKEKCSPDARAFMFFSKDKVEERSHRFGNGKIDKAFIDRVETLATDLAVRINEIHMSAPAAPPAARRGKVFLAAVPGDLEENRTQLATVLDGLGWEVAPKLNDCPVAVEECTTQAKAISGDSIAFVQLLSPYVWKPVAYDRIQFEAVGETVPCFRYRSDQLDLSKVANAEHQQWLEKNVVALSLPGIEKNVTHRLEELLQRKAKKAVPEPTPDGGGASFITIDLDQAEPPTLGKDLIARLAAKKVYSVVPEAPPSFEDCLLNEHGLLTIYGFAPYGRVEKALLKWRAALIKHLASLPGAPPCGVFLSEPAPAQKMVSMAFPGLKLIRADDPGSFDQFVSEVLRYASSRVGTT